MLCDFNGKMPLLAAACGEGGSSDGDGGGNGDSSDGGSKSIGGSGSVVVNGQ